MVNGLKPLEGIRVVDFSRVLAGPYCAMLLADLGADVVKVEMPGTGDPLREQGPPFLHGIGMTFLAANRNKRSLALDLKSPREHAIALRLCERADVLVENFRPDVMPRLGLGYDEIHALNPSLVYASISGYGADGPDSMTGAFDLTIQAIGGYMSMTGDRQGRPIKLGTSAFDLVAGMNCQAAILAALFQRLHRGRGQKVETSLLEGQIVFLERAALQYLMTGTMPARQGCAHATRVPHKAYATRDALWTVIDAADQGAFTALAKALDLEALLVDERFVDAASRVRHREALYGVLDREIVTLDADTLMNRLSAHGVPATPVHTIEQALAHCERTHRRMVHTLRHPVYGTVPQIHSAARYSGFDVENGWTAPPLVDEHGEAVLREWLSMSEAEIASLRAPSPA